MAQPGAAGSYKTPTESTPLSPQISQQHRNYNTSQPSASHIDVDEASSSEESASGYISGSGRRESVIENAQRKSRLSASPRNASVEGRTPRTSALAWAFENAGSNEVGRVRSPGSAASPRMKPSLTDNAGSTIEDPSSARAADATIRRRTSKLNKASEPVSKPGKRNSLQDDPNQEEDSWAWFRNLADKYGAIELDNKGSVARDHLALERTFLAWLRTSLAFASIGIAITQLFRLNSTLHPDDPNTVPGSPLFRLRTVGKPLGTTFLGVAILILLLGWRRYFESQYWIIRGKFPASRGSVFLVTFLTAALVVVSLVVVVVVGRVI